MSQPLDYKELLKKYMAKMRCQEGYAFCYYSPGNEFTREERIELEKIAAQAMSDCEVNDE